MAEFWDLTPRETWITIEAAGWRAERDARRDVALAWHVAALARTKILPSLRQLLHPPKARKLEGEELERRRAEHAGMVAALDPALLRGQRSRSRMGEPANKREGEQARRRAETVREG